MWVLCAVRRLWLLATLWMSDSHNVLSSTTGSAPVDSCLWLLSWSHSISYLVFSFSCCLLLFPILLSFPKNPAFSLYAWSRTACFVILASSSISDLICSRTHVFIFLAVQGVCADTLLIRTRAGGPGLLPSLLTPVLLFTHTSQNILIVALSAVDESLGLGLKGPEVWLSRGKEKVGKAQIVWIRIYACTVSKIIFPSVATWKNKSVKEAWIVNLQPIDT